MHADKQNPDTPPATEELTGNLKRTVDEVRGQQPPDGSAAKSVERAARLGDETARRRQRQWVGVLVGSIAAAYFVGLCLWTFREEIKGEADDALRILRAGELPICVDGNRRFARHHQIVIPDGTSNTVDRVRDVSVPE